VWAGGARCIVPWCSAWAVGGVGAPSLPWPHGVGAPQHSTSTWQPHGWSSAQLIEPERRARMTCGSPAAAAASGEMKAVAGADSAPTALISCSSSLSCPTLCGASSGRRMQLSSLHACTGVCVCVCVCVF